MDEFLQYPEDDLLPQDNFENERENGERYVKSFCKFFIRNAVYFIGLV